MSQYGSGLRVLRGDSVSWPSAATNPDGSAVDLTGATVAARLESSDGTLIATLTVTITNAAGGLFTISATDVASAAWPAGDARLLIHYTIGSTVSTVTTPVRIDRGW